MLKRRTNELKEQIIQTIESCDNLLVVAFFITENHLTHLENKTDLSTDQKYLMDVCIAVSSENCSLDLSLRNPENIAHSRSLTLANRVLRLYVATGNLTENLKTLTMYIMKV